MLHAPKQTRSRKTLERILASARSLMATSGVDGVGITQIVADAKSSVGSFYARFDGKEDLVRYLHELLWEEAVARWQEGVGGWAGDQSTQKRVGLVLETVRRAVVPDIGLRTSLTHVLGDEGKAARKRFDDQVVDDSLSLLSQDHGIRHPDPSACIPLGIGIVLSTLRDRLALLGQPTDVPDFGGELTEELTVVLRGYWGVGRLVRVEGDAPDTEMEYFDIWG